MRHGPRVPHAVPVTPAGKCAASKHRPIPPGLVQGRQTGETVPAVSRRSVPHQADRFDSGPRAMEHHTTHRFRRDQPDTVAAFLDQLGMRMVIAWFDDDDQPGWWFDTTDTDPMSRHDPEANALAVAMPAELVDEYGRLGTQLNDLRRRMITAAELCPTEPRTHTPCPEYSGSLHTFTVPANDRTNTPAHRHEWWPVCATCGNSRDAHGDDR